MTEVEPWKHLEGQSVVSIQKIIGFMGATFGDDHKPMFGGIALELQAFLDCQGGKKTKKKKKTAAQETKEKDANKWEVGALSHFSKLCEQALGIKGNVDFGRDRKQLRKLRVNHSPEFIVTAMEHFFTEKDNVYLFRGGAIKDFCNSFTALCKECGISETDIKQQNNIPVGV